MIESLLFDLDGTLLDTLDEFTLVVNEFRDEFKLSPLPSTAVRPWIYLGASSLMEHCLNVRKDDERYEALLSQIFSRCLQHLGKHTQLFEGADNLLTWWESLGRPWGVGTTRLTAFTGPLLKQLRLEHRAGVIVSADTVGKAKPHPEPLWHACEKLGVQPQNSVFVGDAPSDILAGKRAGLKTVAALYGYLPLNEDPKAWEADQYILEAFDLKAYLHTIDPSL